MDVIKILLVEDQQLVREGLKGLLALHDDLQVVGEAGWDDDAHAHPSAVDLALHVAQVAGIGNNVEVP